MAARRSGPSQWARGALGILGVAWIAGLAPALAEDEALAVSLAQFDDVAVVRTWSAPAEAVALARHELPARLSAQVEELDVDVGDRVAPGDRIARLDCSEFRDRLEQAEGRRDELEAQRTFALTRQARLQRLFDEGAVAADALDEVAAEVDALAASVRSQRGAVRDAERSVERCDVRAAVAGVVSKRRAGAGDWAATGAALVQIVPPRKLEVRAEIPARVLRQSPAPEAAEFKVDGERYPVRLRSIVDDTDPATGMREARLRFEEEVPVPGTPGRLSWQDPQPAVPAHLLVQRDGELGVMRAADGEAVFERLPEAVRGRPAAAPELDGHSRLIIDGRHAVRDGQRIAVPAEAGEDG